MKIIQEGNGVSRQLPLGVDLFLQDIAQMTGAITYLDIMKHEYTEDDIKKLTNLRRRAHRYAAEVDDDNYEGYLSHVIAPKVVEIIKPMKAESASSDIDLSEYEYVANGSGYDRKWAKYRKFDKELGKGVWVAKHQDTGEIKSITYDQAQGFEPIEDSGIARLSRDLGKMLLPKRESTNDSGWEYVEETTTNDEIFGDIVEGAHYIKQYSDNMIGYIYPPSESEKLYRAKLSSKNHFKSLGYNVFIELDPAKEFLDETARKLASVTYEDIKQQLEEIDTHEYLKIYIDEPISPSDTAITATIEGTLTNNDPITMYDSSYIRTQGHIDFIKQQYAKCCKEIDAMRERGYLGVKDESCNLKEQNYGGAYDILDDEYFTRDDLTEFSEEVVSAMSSLFNIDAEVLSSYIENGVIELTVGYEEGEYTHEEKIDMRKIQKPKDLSKYADVFARELFKQIKEAWSEVDIPLVESAELDEEDVYWYGKYTNINGDIKKMILKIPTLDYDVADREFGMTIPEPFTRYKLWGHFTGKDSYMGKQLSQEGYEYLQESKYGLTTPITTGAPPNKINFTEVPSYKVSYKEALDDNNAVAEELNLKDVWAKLFKSIKDKYSNQFDVFRAADGTCKLYVVDFYWKGTMDKAASFVFDADGLDTSSEDAFTAQVFAKLDSKLDKVLSDNFGDAKTEASSKSSQVSKMTHKGAKIPNYDWAKFDCGAYVQVTTPQNPALDLKVGSKAGRVVGKVKDTYVYASDNKTGTMGRDNDFKSELDAFAPQSCLVEIHEDYKIKQHGQLTTRIIIPVEWLREIDEKTYKDSINAIPRKGLNKLFNKNKKRIESIERKKFNFRCRKCSNEFVSEYDYPLPTDCNACVICPECGGVAQVVGKEPITESKLKQKKGISDAPVTESFGNFNVSEPSNFASNGRSFFSKPEDWKEKHVWVTNLLKPLNFKCVGSSRWNSTWEHADGDEITVDYWDDFDVIKEYVSMSVEDRPSTVQEAKEMWGVTVTTKTPQGEDREQFRANTKEEIEKKRQELLKDAGENVEVSDVYKVG